jgi:hypothetical protein
MFILYVILIIPNVILSDTTCTTLKPIILIRLLDIFKWYLGVGRKNIKIPFLKSLSLGNEVEIACKKRPSSETLICQDVILICCFTMFVFASSCICL